MESLDRNLIELVDRNTTGIISDFSGPARDSFNKITEQLTKQEGELLLSKEGDQAAWLKLFAHLPLQSLLPLLDLFEKGRVGTLAFLLKLDGDEFIDNNVVNRLIIYQKLEKISRIFSVERLKTILDILRELEEQGEIQ